VDATSRAAWAAPFSIYPLDPIDCALLICDYSVYESLMAYDRFEDAIVRAGLSSHHYLPAANTTGSSNAVFATLRSRGRSLHLRQSAMTQMLLELIEPTVYARALAEAVQRSMPRGVSGSFVFANERAVWT
jgi:hypothetical protein